MEDLASQMSFDEMLNSKKRNCKVPVGPPVVKRSDFYFYLFAEFNVPVSRAAWYLKLLAYIFPQVNQDQQSRSKSRSKAPDTFAEWTKNILNFMEQIWDLLTKPEFTKPKSPSPNSPLIICTLPASKEMVQDYWNYGQDLLKYLFGENMLDKDDVIGWILGLGEKLRAGDEFQLRTLLPFFLYYLNDIVRSNYNSRRLAYIVAQMLYWIRVELPEENAKVKKEETEKGGDSPTNNNLDDDPKWRTVIWGLNTIIQLITMYAPGSLVWYEPICQALHPGSPLDILPQSPSEMMIAPGASERYGGDQLFQQHLREFEREISRRSLATEVKWSWDKCRDPQTASTITNVLNILDLLDSHEAELKPDTAKDKDSIKVVYEQIFATTSESDNEAIVGVLCDWATTSYRAGRHRGVLVAKLLAIKQDQIEENTERKLIPYFQEYLFNYLQITSENSAKMKEKTSSFNNLIILFGELIRHDIFSHSYYVQE